MANSMTGYGKGTAAEDQTQVVVELKSVNNRYLDLFIRLPKRLNPLEATVRSHLQAELSRGKIETSITLIDFKQADQTVLVNVPLAQAYYNALHELSEALDVNGEVSALQLSQFSDVLKLDQAEPDYERLEQLLLQALAEAVVQFKETRRIEGERLMNDVITGCDQLEALRCQVAERAALVPELYRAKLQDRWAELLSPHQVALLDPNRLAAEVLLFADKADIHEELVRLDSHIVAMRSTVQQSAAIGKKLDFFCQEMNREINTMGSKANDQQLTHLIIDMKSIVEKIREQVQNIE